MHNLTGCQHRPSSVGENALDTILRDCSLAPSDNKRFHMHSWCGEVRIIFDLFLRMFENRHCFEIPVHYSLAHLVWNCLLCLIKGQVTALDRSRNITSTPESKFKIVWRSVDTFCVRHDLKLAVWDKGRNRYLNNYLLSCKFPWPQVRPNVHRTRQSSYLIVEIISAYGFWPNNEKKQK